MTLTVAEIKALKPRSKAYKKADAGGLYLHINPTGSKLWRYKFRIAGKEKLLAFGRWPEVSLASAREARDLAKQQIAKGMDPSLERKRNKAAAKVAAGTSFAVIAEEFIDRKLVAEGRADGTLKKARWFLKLLAPAIGKMPVTDVDSQMLLAALRRLEAKGNYETAKKCRSFASRVFRYAIWTGRAKNDPAASLQGALITRKAKHYAAILEPKKLGGLLRAIDSYDGHPATKFALRIAPHVFVRPGELRHAEWHEINLHDAIWTIPAGKMKARREHAVPLSNQVQNYFTQLSNITGVTGYVFPSFHTPKRPMSENTVNVAFRRMGFGKDEVTAHGLRSTASTLLNESGLWNPDAIERALAHGDSNAVRGAYSRGNYWEERVKMAQWWSDYLDQISESLSP
ncbi:integrase arm-type DNA-binding domain-containing protein [Sphingorhabdus sp. Alg239-R122]|uniref:tyrosine-type recombinase/integrase n=1 Tax=Sphingorhabdus sp. Alg239-R122 TaxID=2305989 RepID=UPI0013DCD9CA|nr:integrase arm-type DNA-binding domain-containing protein [Sphingorhabdus sp. Alg239-R122]